MKRSTGLHNWFNWLTNWAKKLVVRLHVKLSHFRSATCLNITILKRDKIKLCYFIQKKIKWCYFNKIFNLLC
jgi:hypothetical protein